MADGGGTVGGSCTTPDPQAAVARMTEIPRVSPIRETLGLDILTNPGARCEVPDSAAGECGRPACCGSRVRQGQDRRRRPADRFSRAQDYGGRQDSSVVDPASVEGVDVVAVDDQFVAG